MKEVKALSLMARTVRHLGVDEAEGGLGPHVSLEAFGGSSVEAKHCIMGI